MLATKVPKIRIALKQLKWEESKHSQGVKLWNSGIESFNHSMVKGGETSLAPDERLQLSVKLLKLGSDPENVSACLTWQEFEKLVEIGLRSYGFATERHVVFKNHERRYEIDLLAAREETVLCIDCKHWDHGSSPGRIRSAVDAQRERVQALARQPKALANILKRSPVGFLLPALVAFRTVEPACIDGTPVVSILRLRNFLAGFSLFSEGLAFEKVERRLLTLDEICRN